MRQCPCEFPIEGEPADVLAAVDGYDKWLGETDTPMTLFFGAPGDTVQKSGLDRCRNTIKTLNVVDIGPGIHFLQEDNPYLIGKELVKCLKRLD